MKKLAIIGVSGLVGKTVLDVLNEEFNSKEFELFLYGSENSKGSIISFQGKDYVIEELSEDALSLGFDYALFLTGEEVSLMWADRFAAFGSIVIDNSSAFRLTHNVPLVVPEINFNTIRHGDKIIANPNCSTIQLVLVLEKIQKLSKIKKIVLSSYQSVSGAGKEALEDLENQSNKFFNKGIVNNIIPKIGGFSANDYCSEENKIIDAVIKDQVPKNIDKMI